MSYPVIRYIADILPSIADREEFVIIKRNGYSVVDYNLTLPDTFPDYDKAPDPATLLHWRIRRECRGLKFSDAGDLIGRPYHKFFNVGERPSTLRDAIDWSRQFVILEKLDGSMIHPVLLGGEVRYMSMRGLTDVAALAERFAQAHGYDEFCRTLLEAGYTPIFEWCSRACRIVVDYPDDRLVLTGIRRMADGAYHSHAAMTALATGGGIEVVRAWTGDFAGIVEFLDAARDEQVGEGWIIRFDDGDCLKVKNLRYLRIHRAKEALAVEKNVWSLILNGNLDDVRAELPESDRDRLDRFSKALWAGLTATATSLAVEVGDIRDGILADTPDPNAARKVFAVDHARKFKGPFLTLAYRIYNGHDAFDEILYYVLKRLHTATQLEEIRVLAGGVRWNEF